MKTNQANNDKGSVLIIAFMTMTILTMICATSLYIASQNTSTGMQTAAWQQSLTGAEAGVDAAVRALNQNGTSGANAWTNWKMISTALPTPAPSASPVAGYTYEPTGGTAATTVPTTSQYLYLPSANLSISYPNTEGTTAVNAWVTIDTAGGLSNSSGSWYRVRSTGQATFQSNSVYKRVSNSRLDNDLRNTLVMNVNRKTGSSGNLGPRRTIEVIMQPVPQGGSAKGITLTSWLQMTGGGSADAFSSPTGQWSLAYRDSSNPMMIAEGATGGQAKFANTGQTYVYGGVTYSGTAPTNVNAAGPPKDVMGQVSTPASVSLPTPTDPTPISGSSGHYNWSYDSPWTGVTTSYNFTSVATYTGGGGLPTNGGSAVTSITATGTASSPGLVIINGDFTVPGGQTFTINPTMTGGVANPSNSYVVVWVKGGQFTTSGSGVINQVAGTNVTWIVDKDVTVSGNSYNNHNGTASTDTFIGVGTSNKFTDSGSATFTATVNAPAYSGTISGAGDYTGAFAGHDLTISGSGSFHYDESLNSGSNPAIGNYAYASWFEDNSDPTRNARDVTNNLHSIVY